MPTITDTKQIHSTDNDTGRNGDPEFWGLKEKPKPSPPAPKTQ